ncbi:MAG: DUF2380 domain-containing protein [Candidatus Marinimicrobia bacterium]|nr:DUF2380 domain-containing protein [Candidatus Neomarinimicrobiota bacterium]
MKSPPIRAGLVPAVIAFLTLPMLLLSQDKQTLAVLDFESRGISAVEAASLTDRLRTSLVRIGKVTVVERGQMQQVLQEQDFQLAGCTSDECAVEVGQILGVNTVVAGSIGKVGSTYSIDIRTIDVGSGEITHSMFRDYRGEIDDLLGIMSEIAQELVAAVVATGSPPAAAPETAATEPQRPRPPPQVKKVGSRFTWLAIIAVAGGGYYGYTQGWFGGGGPGLGVPRVGQPPALPAL